MTTTANEVKGLIGETDSQYFFTDGRNVFRADKDAVPDCITGCLQGRWECTLEHFNHSKAAYAFVRKTANES